jgi:O-antigen ligase
VHLGAAGSRWQATAFYLGFASAASILFSIAVSQILLALSLAALFLGGEKLEFPAIRLPLAVFFTQTAVAVLVSGDPQGGTPQIRKFFVFTIILVISSTFKTILHIRNLVLVWAGIGSISALWALVQFLDRRREALQQNADNYGFYLDGRIKGLASHWMTFGGEEMIVLLMLASWLFFSSNLRRKAWAWPLLGLLWASITLGMTRSIFLLGVPVGILYLLWQRRWSLVMAVPVLAAAGAILVSTTLRERVVSVIRPHGDDSNQQHALARLVGWEIVKAHPWFGIGPEQVGRRFDQYLPLTVRRPLPKGWYGHLHNVYLQYAAERGIPGLLAVLWLIGKALVDFIRQLRRSRVPPEARFVLHGSIAVILAILAQGLFEYNLGDSEVLTMFLSVVACGYVASRCRGAQALPAQSAEPLSARLN